MSIVTRIGDNSETSLADGSRIPKSDIRLHAIGTVDELNAAVGMALAEGNLPETLPDQLSKLQHFLFRLGADLASPMTVKDAKRITATHTKEVEGWIDALESSIPPLAAFILHGGCRAAAQLHVTRTVCRRAERWAVALSEFEDVNREALVFLNRLGDYLFLAAREVNRGAGVEEVKVEY